jgi:hypothetical protein
MREVNKKGLIFGILFSMFLFSNFAFALEEVQYSTSPSAVWDMATSAVGNVFSFLFTSKTKGRA